MDLKFDNIFWGFVGMMNLSLHSEMLELHQDYQIGQVTLRIVTIQVIHGYILCQSVNSAQFLKN